ncbi:hypothetical protein C9374_010806 [Naegleria lovaniensis]|uniref:Amine oxidase domain-containing protein n=1 Tax=Naegleria lovaniensis TaxID=51637 RepID=A0AA88GBA8_NAELO|nr:uncharacterized protein C9374_010806 [Naegleria lovaniensis]KAG2374522.1 hypothetical protein C9374_010806 [Naegleria lovaniensis]
MMSLSLTRFYRASQILRRAVRHHDETFNHQENFKTVKKRIGIIGGGPGGLTSAMLLASKGFDVTVFEKGSRVGGRNSSIMVGDSKIDVGPTLLIMKFILDAVFKDAHRKSEDYLKFIRLDPMYRLIFDKENTRNADENRTCGDETTTTYVDCHDMQSHEKMEHELERVFGSKAVKGYHQWYEFEKKRYPSVMKLLQRTYSNHWDIINWDAIKALPMIGLHKSMMKMLDRYFENPLMKISFSYQSKYLGMSPWNTPSVYGLIPYAEHSFGVYHVEGGLSTISEQMAKIITEELGGKIHLNSTVNKIVIERGSRMIKEIEVTRKDEQNGSEITEAYHFDEYICNADFPYIVRNNIPNSEEIFQTWTPTKIDSKQFSCSGFNMYLELDKLYENIHTHVIAFPKDIKKAYKTMMVPNSGDWTENITLYVRNSCVVDKTVSPQGKSGLFVMVFVPNLQVDQNHTDWSNSATIQRVKMLALEILERKCGFNDIQNHILSCKILTPLTWRSEKHVEFGSVFSMSNTLFQSLSFRPRNKFHELDNLYLTGGHTHPGSGLPVIYESARMVCDLLCQKYNIPYTPTSII